MKRCLEPDGDDEGTPMEVEEIKKVRFPFVAPDKYKPLPEVLTTKLQENHDLYLSPDKWNWTEVEKNLEDLQLDFSSNEKDHLDELIEANQKAPFSFPPTLLALHRDILKAQQKVVQAHVESVKNGEFQDNSTKVLLCQLAEEQRDIDCPLLVDRRDIAYRLRKIDYSVPFIVHLGSCFREFATSKGQQLNGKVVDEPENPVTLKMLKENPEGHGLDKTVVDKFSDDHEIVDIQLNFRGKKKRLRAFKDSGGILIPCKEKNCTHSELDYNNVSICSKSKQSTSSCASDKPTLQSKSPETSQPSWDIDISDEDVVICESKSPAKGPQSADRSRNTPTSPQITGIHSLAPNFQHTRLNPLASQLPNPIKRSRAMPRMVMNSQPLHAFQICSTVASSRPGILSKTSTSIQPGVMMIQQNRRKILPGMTMLPSTSTSPQSTHVQAQSLTASQLQVQQRVLGLMRKTVLNSAIPGVSSATTVSPKTDKVSTTLENLTKFQGKSDAEDADDEPMVIDETSSTSEVKDKGQEQDTNDGGNESDVAIIEPTEDENESESTPSIQPFNIATNIFENDDDDEGDGDIEGEQSQSGDCDIDGGDDQFNVPQIVSTVGGVDMLTPETILVTSESEVDYDSPLLSRAKEMKLKQIRSKLVIDQLKQKLEFPEQTVTSNCTYITCSICERAFTVDTMQSYRVHLLRDHKIVMKGLPDTKTRPNANGRVGKVESIPAHYRKPQEPVPVQGKVEVKEWYRCKACDELLRKKETPEHRAACCPNQRADFAFVPVKISTGKKSEVPLLCGLCEKSCESAIGLRQHLTTVHREISSKILLEPDMRCGSCLTQFHDSVHLTLHCQACTSRKASAETMLELAKGMLYCEICQKEHDSINETQDCYTNTQMIRCIICLNVVLSRGNFFHHMKTYHFRSTVGICCPFCDLGEIPIRDCFIHIIDNHYNPILQLHNHRAGLRFDSNNRIAVPSTITDSTSIAAPTTPAPVRVNLGRRPLPQGVTPTPTTTASRLILSNLTGQGLTRLALPNSTGGTGTTTPQYITLRAVNPRTGLQLNPAMLNQSRTVTIQPGQIRTVRVNGAGATGGGILRQIQSSSGIQIVSGTGNHQIIRTVRPISTGTGTTSSPVRTMAVPRTATVAGIQRAGTGTIQAITPGQLQRLRLPLLQGNQKLVSGTLVNFGNAANLNLLHK